MKNKQEKFVDISRKTPSKAKRKNSQELTDTDQQMQDNNQNEAIFNAVL